MSARWIVVVVVVASCATPAGPAPAEPPPPRTMFAIGTDALGPITGRTRATLTSLRELVGPHGYRVKGVQSGGLEFRVYDGAEMLFYVVPNDDGSLFNVHVVSDAIPIAAHPEWQIGRPFARDDLLDCCECWGSNPVCFRRGDHVALGFTRGCEDLGDEEARTALAGVKIQRAVWSPSKFETCDSDGTSSPSLPAWIPRAD